MSSLQRTTLNFRFVEKGAVNSDIFILSNPKIPSSGYGPGLTNETSWLENFFNYKKSKDGIMYSK